jgi:hypothetical protein
MIALREPFLAVFDMIQRPWCFQGQPRLTLSCLNCKRHRLRARLAAASNEGTRSLRKTHKLLNTVVFGCSLLLSGLSWRSSSSVLVNARKTLLRTSNELIFNINWVVRAIHGRHLPRTLMVRNGHAIAPNCRMHL